MIPNPKDYQNLVKRVAYQIVKSVPTRVDVRDLISAGNLGLLDAIQKYDPNKNDNFEAYAEIRIRGEILDEMRRLDWVPRSVRQKTRILEKTVKCLRAELEREPEDQEIADIFSLDINGYHQLREELAPATSLSWDEISNRTYQEKLAIPPEDSPLYQLIQRYDMAKLGSAVEQLPERERLVISFYYLEGLKMKEIGVTIGVTESRISQIHAHAISRLKGILESEEK